MVAAADADGEADEPGSWHPEKARRAARNDAEATMRFMVEILNWGGADPDDFPSR